MNKDDEAQNSIIVFNNRQIRRVFHNEEWWYVVSDVIVTLTDSNNPTLYLKAMRRRDAEFNKGWVQIVSPLPIVTQGGIQKLNCANTEGIFRLIQSIPSPKAEPFKRWLAKVGYERIKEIDDPELASNRARELYEAKGYPSDWIEKRMRGIQIREELTNEWKQRNVGDKPEYAILTAEICKATFGMTPSEYKKFKNLKRENLRDHMNDLELIFTMLGEASTTKIARKKNAQGFGQNRTAARAGGRVAGIARAELESEAGEKVITSENYLDSSKKLIDENT